MANIVEFRIRSFEQFEELLRIEAEIKALAERREELRAKLVSVVKRAGGDVKCKKHHFRYCTRATWMFSEKVSKLQGRVEAQKKYEIEHKVATPGKPTEFIKIEGE